MPCESMRATPQQTEAERRQEIADALRELEMRLSNGTVTVGIGPTGAVVFKGWNAQDRRRVSDVCAFRKLTQQRSFALRRAVERAEQQAGRKVNMASVSAGVHSHDGGQSWHAGH